MLAGRAPDAASSDPPGGGPALCGTTGPNTAPNSAPGDEAVTTIYMAGFPDDFCERELHNLFAFAAGYEGCALKYPAGPECDKASAQILGFARFRAVPDALEACRVLNGRVLDAERGAMLRVEMAKKNLILGPARARSSFALYGGHVPTLPPALLPTFSVASAPRGLARATPLEAGSAPWPDDECAGRSLSLCVPGSATPVPVAAPRKVSAPPAVPAWLGAASWADQKRQAPAWAEPAHGENPPCNTLYVGNLPPGTCELELRALFSGRPGYRRLSLKAKAGGAPMCFVEFDDVASAACAMDALAGTLLANSTKGGIRLSFSKNPLGVRPPSGAPAGLVGASGLSDAGASDPADAFLLELIGSSGAGDDAPCASRFSPASPVAFSA